MEYYKVTIVTGDRPGAGTSANVTLTIFGEVGNTGPRKLEASRKSFQRNQVIMFL